MAVKLKVHEDSTRLTVHSDGTVTFTAEQGFPFYPEMQTKSVRYTPSESAIADTVTPDSGYGGLSEVGVTVDAIPSNYVGSNVPRRSESDLTEEGGTVTAPSGYYSQEASKAVPELDRERCIIDFGRYYDTDDGERFWKIYGYFQETDGVGGYVEPYTRIDGDVMWFNAIPTGTTVTPREARQTIGGANVMMEGGVTVDAIPSDYVGSGITRRSRDDLSGDYDEGSFWVDGPAGYYADNFDYEVPNGTEGTPSAVVTIDTSGAEAVITPTVTNSGGYIEGGTKNGSDITVTAAELVAGNTLYCDDSGNWDVSETETFVVPAGTEGTPTASKGAVSNHAVQVTPSVTNAAGYITGGTKTGTPVTVTAAELVSGNLSITQNGTGIDVAEYASVDVSVSGGTPRTSSDLVVSGATVTAPAGVYATDASKTVASGTAGTPTATKGAVSNHSVSVTPSVTNTTGYITGSTKTGTAVTVSASELVSGSETKTANGTYDVTNLASLVVNVSGGSSMNVQIAQSTNRATSSTYTSVISLTCTTAGKYDIYWDCFRSSTGGTNGSQLYIGGQAYGTANTTFTNHAQTNHLTGVTLTANQTVAVYARSRGSNYYAYVGTLIIKQTS